MFYQDPFSTISYPYDKLHLFKGEEVLTMLLSLDNKRGKVGFMAVKVDLKKAYDRLE